MSIGKAQPTTIRPLLLVVATCMVTFMMGAHSGWAEPIGPSPYAPAPDAYTQQEQPESISNPQLELLRLAAILSQLPSPSSSAVPGIPLSSLLSSKTSGLAGILGDVEECLASIINTKDCPLQIINSIISLELNDIGTECCRAVLSVQEGCLDKIPLMSSLVPSVLRDSCTHTILAA